MSQGISSQYMSDPLEFDHKISDLILHLFQRNFFLFDQLTIQVNLFGIIIQNPFPFSIYQVQERLQ